MSARLASGGRMTVEAYLERCRTQPEGRYELVDGVPCRMSPERNVHALIRGAVYRAMSDAVRAAAPMLVTFVDGPTIPTGSSQAREPDVVIHPRAGIDRDALKLDEPVILVEVVSPATEKVDARDKLREYLSLGSVRHYLIVDPTRRTVIHHRRSEAGLVETSTMAGGTLSLDPPGISVEIARFFEDLPLRKAN